MLHPATSLSDDGDGHGLQPGKACRWRRTSTGTRGRAQAA